MSHSRRDRENISHNGVLLQKEREKDKKRREQELAKQEEAVEEPIFSQPRKVTTSRQDSLTRNIKKTLGDPEALFREPNPNKWLGTSRSAQTPNTPASIQSQNDCKVFPTSSQISNMSSQSGPLKRGLGSSSGSGGSRIQSMNMYSHSQMYKSREEASKQSFNQNRNSHNNYSSSYNMKSGRQGASPKPAGNQHSSFNSSHLPISNHHAGILSSDLLESDRLLDIPVRMSERDRVSSVDSDMLGGVENILKEMVDLPPSITEIKTPSINENKFSFMKRKITGPESSLESSTADALDTGDASDVESSGEDTEDDVEDEPQSWSLMDLRKESQSSSKPLLSTDASSKSESGASLNITNDRFSARSAVEYNRHQTQSRGRKEEKKQSAVQKSASSNKRSSSSHRGAESSESRIPESFNQTDPVISRTINKGENYSSSRQPIARNPDSSGLSRQGSSRIQPLSPPYGSIQANYKSSPTKGMRVTKARPGQNSPNQLDEQAKRLCDNSSKKSHVSKETISTTTATTKDRHSVGRKGPSPRLGGYTNSSTSSAPRGSPDPQMSDDDNHYTTEQKENHTLSESDADTSSNSDSESSSSSDSESDNEEGDLPKDDADYEDPQAQASSPSWNLDNIRENAERSPALRNDSKVSASRRPSQSSPTHVTSPTTTYQPNFDQHNPNTVPINNDKTKMKMLTKQNAKKSGRQSFTGSSKLISNKSPSASHRRGNNSKVLPVSHNTMWNANTSTVESTNQKSSSIIKGRHNLSGNASSCETKHQIANVRNTVTTEHVSKHGKAAQQENTFLHKSLLVRIKASLLNSDVKPVSCATSYQSPPCSTSKRSQKLGHLNVSSATPPKVARSPESSSTQHTIPQKRTLTTVSTGSETEQPIRRANRVEVAYADSRDWTDNSTLANKRRHNNFEQSYDEETNKRFKRDKVTSKQTSPRSTAHSPWRSNQSLHKSSPNNQWRDQQNAEFSQQQNERQNQQNDHEYRNNRSHSSSQARQESPTSNKSAIQHSNASSASFVLPDSSVPGEQESIQTSDWYMREGKRMKHEGEGNSIVDSRTGRTKPGEALNRALAYFEASLFFIMSGYVMESENREDRLESSSNSSSSSNSPVQRMYHQTLEFLDFVLKMRPHDERDDRIFKRIMISCIRCQAFLYFRLFKLKKDMAMKYSDVLTDQQFKTMSKSNRTPSPWHHANSAPNVLSPMSPAVPSPFGHGPSPVNSNGEQVSSSTQAGKMTPPSHGSYSFPQKMYDIYRQHHTIMSNLLQAHEKWDQGESMLEGHTDFFRNIDTLCNRTLTFHSSLRDVFLYHKMVLHQLRTLATNSPRE